MRRKALYLYISAGAVLLLVGFVVLLETNHLPAFLRFVDTPSAALPEIPLSVQDIGVGTGAQVPSDASAVAGWMFGITYVSTLQDGTVFDSQYANTPFYFTVGKNQILPGIEKGVEGMRVGGLRIITIPPALAYGSKGLPGKVPPNTPVLVQVILRSITDIDEGGLGTSTPPQAPRQ